MNYTNDDRKNIGSLYTEMYKPKKTQKVITENYNNRSRSIDIYKEYPMAKNKQELNSFLEDLQGELYDKLYKFAEENYIPGDGFDKSLDSIFVFLEIESPNNDENFRRKAYSIYRKIIERNMFITDFDEDDLLSTDDFIQFSFTIPVEYEDFEEIIDDILSNIDPDDDVLPDGRSWSTYGQRLPV